MIKYQYQILRYVHDQFTGEFGNLGIVLYAPEQKFLKCKVVTKYARLSGFFGEINGQFLLNSIKYFETAINKIGVDFNDLIVTSIVAKDLTSITGEILIKDDSALQLSETKYGLDPEPEGALAQLYSRMIERYNEDLLEPSHTDHYTWSRVYKIHFDRLEITSKLKKHIVKTDKDSIHFDKSWKNGSWNCFQPLSFDLKSEDAIKNKVYRWSGIIKELETAKEAIHLYLLTSSPTENNKLEKFIKETLTIKEKAFQVEIIDETKAASFVAQVRKDMIASAASHPEEDALF